MAASDKNVPRIDRFFTHVLAHPRRYWTSAVVLSCLLAVGLVGSLAHKAEMDRAGALAAETKRHALDLIALTLDGKIMGSLSFLGISSYTPKQVVQGDLPADAPGMVEMLSYLGRYCNAEGSFIVDSRGIIQTSWDRAGKSSTGLDVKFRPYFQIAMQGKENIYAALSLNTNRRALYLAAPIYVENRTDSTVIGVSSIRLGMESIDAMLGSWGLEAMLLTPNGVVFAGTNPDWLFRLVGQPSPERIQAINATRQFGNLFDRKDVTFLPLDPTRHVAVLNGHEHVVASAPINWNDPQGQWTLVLLDDVSGLFWSPRRLLAGGGVLAAALLLCFAGYQALRNAGIKRQAAASLRHSQAEMSQIFNTSASGMRVIARDFTVSKVNEAFLALTGYSRDEVEGRPCSEYFGGSACDGDDCTLRRILAGEQRTESIVLKSRKDGMPVYCELTATPFLSADGDIIGVIEDFRDITERLNAQDAVRKSEIKYRELVESASSIILKLDMEGNFTFFNEFAQKFFGYTSEEIIGQPLVGTIMRETDGGMDDFGAFLRSIAEDPAKYEKSENESVCKDGRRVWVSWTNRVLTDDVFGEVNGLLRIGLDATERKRAQDRLNEAMEVISSSIRYASRIQRAILPSTGSMESLLPRSFTLWEPRDLVGGDIYWVKECPAGMTVILADCTGHGVPGAFMTLIASGALERAYSLVDPADPAALIGKMNQYVKVVLGQDCMQKDGDCSDDGLDLGACFISRDLRELTFAGAHFPLFFIQGGRATVIKGDRQGIGYRSQSLDASFTNHSLRLEPGQRFYMATDGIFDQIGGPKRRSYGKNRFIDLLLSLDDCPVSRQGSAIREAHLAYQGAEHRRDDVAVLGFEIDGTVSTGTDQDANPNTGE